MKGWQDLARNAGFYTSADRLRQSTCQKPRKADFCGMRIVGTPLMPEGYAAIVSGNSATIIGPNGVWTISDDGLAALASHEGEKE